jgi:hypothetical protein
MREDEIVAIHDQVEAEILAGRFVTDPDGHPLTGDADYWRTEIGHPLSGHGYCRTCGPATSCLFGVYVDAVIETAVRRAVKLTR